MQSLAEPEHPAGVLLDDVGDPAADLQHLPPQNGTISMSNVQTRGCCPRS